MYWKPPCSYHIAKGFRIPVSPSYSPKMHLYGTVRVLRLPTMLLLLVVGHTNLRNIFNWLWEASVTMYMEPKKASGPLFHPVIPPNQIPKVL